MRTRWISLGMAITWFGCSMTSGFGAPSPPVRQMEIGLWGGFSPDRVVGRMTSQDSWNSFLLSSVTEQTGIRSKAGAAPAAGLSYSFFYSPHLGVQVLAGCGQADLATSSAFDFAWTWTDGSGAAKSESWSGTGRLTRVPVCLNLVWKQGAGLFTVEVSGGPACYWSELRQGSTFGYGVTRVSLGSQPPGGTMTQAVDALAVPLTVPNTSWWSAGANIGGSLNVRLADFIGLKAEARYFYCPPKRVSWTPEAGTYDGMFGNGILAEPFTADDIAYLSGSGQKLEQKTDLSFVQFSLGMTFFLGRRLPH